MAVAQFPDRRTAVHRRKRREADQRRRERREQEDQVLQCRRLFTSMPEPAWLHHGDNDNERS